ncbi:MAG: DNA-directed RNA polymerase subunit omega [Victivallales bacterium]|nr:DNA-directed RNA polymerase subunit omega [Victivallales bacterium]
MNNKYLEKAKKIITDPKMLSIVAAKRARQLAMGARPMVKCDCENHLDIALFEIAEGKLDYASAEEVAAAKLAGDTSGTNME